jgi:hypothetical protein
MIVCASLGNPRLLQRQPPGLRLIFHLERAAFHFKLSKRLCQRSLTTVLATEYDIEPAFITTAVFTSTLLSPLTLTPILALLGA